MFSFSGRISAREAADIAFQRVVEQARQPIFFTEYGVPDTLDGRFELLCLHAFLYFHRLKTDRPLANKFCQSLFNRMFADFDRTLREMGVGDLSIGKQVKRMARAFYGRVLCYEAGLAGDRSTLAGALARNLFGTIGAAPSAAGAMEAYTRRAAQALRSQALADLLAGQVCFETPRRPWPTAPRSKTLEAEAQ